MTHKKHQSSIVRIIASFAPVKGQIFFITVFGIICIILYSLMPAYMSNAIAEIDDSNFSPLMKNVVFNLAVYLALCIVNQILSITCNFMVQNAENKVIARQTVAIKHKYDIVPISFLNQFTSGDLSRRVAGITGELYADVLYCGYSILRSVVFFITTIIAMLSLNPVLCWVVVSSLPICIITARFVAGKTQKYYTKNAAASKTIYSFLDDRTVLHAFFTAHGLGSVKDFDKPNEDSCNGQIGEDTAVAVNTTYITFIQNFMYLVITLVFGFLLLNGNVDSAQFAILPAFLVYSQRFLMNSTVVTTTTNVLQRIVNKSVPFYEIMDYPDEITAEEEKTIREVGEIKFENVSAAAQPFRDDAVNNLNFTIKAGSSVAFVGETEDMPERIAQFLAKFSAPTLGRILIDGEDLMRIKSRSYYKRIGVAFEKPFIFKGTVADNLLYGIRKTLPANVVNLTKKFGFDEFISALPNGYETKLSSDTFVITSAEKQALNLVRTILQSPDLLILSNAINEFDAQTEQNINDKIISIKRLTKVFITKNLTSIKNCDFIYFCQNGEIVESGTHTELLNKKGSYYNALIK
ncbi:MAG: ABC transporter ATP-binding protein/permease [Christensenellaceae bacterium]|jgi:ATP-binding cassette subfamily B protein|nr:ABC transporter ATP-binding protein/permease [Christensenellaceae bacterium]